MKKIGILAFIQPYTRNYGAVLQAYALSKIIQKMGYDVELIDIRSSGSKSTLVASLKANIREIIEGNPFRSFLKSQVSISKPLYSFNELTDHARQYCAVIVGSDQVWRPEYCGNLALHYFLDFVPEGVKRISYAASFGVDKWFADQPTTENVKKEIWKFKAVSVRELAGVGICKELFDISATHTLDPTLLADKGLFLSLLPQHKKESQYIASFVLDRVEETKAIELFLSNKTGKSIISLNKQEVAFFGRKWNKFLSIKEWLMLLRDSEMVITDSFHCVCFSLIFQKNFICIGNQARGLSRLKSLLKMINLEDRFFMSLEEVTHSNIWELAIDYSKVDACLAKQRDTSLKFLKNSLI